MIVLEINLSAGLQLFQKLSNDKISNYSIDLSKQQALDADSKAI